jgi:hypothetical protein
MKKFTSLRTIRIIISFYAVVLIVSGLTAIPLRLELSVMNSFIGEGTYIDSFLPSFSSWISLINSAIEYISEEYPFLAYGYDWMAFGHFVIAIAFIGAAIDPVRRIWVIEFGIIACVLLIPYSFIMGFLREIPIYWSVIDSLFGFFGIIPLIIARVLVLRYSTDEQNNSTMASGEL